MIQTLHLPGEQVVDPEILLIHTDQRLREVQEACEASKICCQRLLASVLGLGETAGQV
jgi:hypothetical protein